MLYQYTKLLRVEQWYKNLLIFLIPIISFGTVTPNWGRLVIGFLGLCCISSVTYIINDWLDREKDKLHPTKKERPLASGKISGKQASIIAIGLFICAIGISSVMGLWYASMVITYFIATNIYSYGAKNIPIVDMLMITGNFILRALAGTSIIYAAEEKTVLVSIFFIILMLLTHKRRSDIKIAGKNAVKHKPVLQFYTPARIYSIRIATYVGIAVSFIILAVEGVTLLSLIAIAALFAATSIAFSKHPHTVIKPKYLFSIWYWDVLVVIALFAVLYS